MVPVATSHKRGRLSPAPAEASSSGAEAAVYCWGWNDKVRIVPVCPFIGLLTVPLSILQLLCHHVYALLINVVCYESIRW